MSHIPPRCVDELAEAKKLSADWLRSECGLYDIRGGAIGIPYRGLDGAVLYERERLPRKEGMRFRHPTGVPLRPYGLDRLGEARRIHTLFLTEGESDTWALWCIGMPALGVAGVNAVGCLAAEYLEGIEVLDVLADNDHTNESFVRSIADRLARIGWTGRLYRLRVPEQHKDVSDWRAADPDAFPKGMETAIERAELVRDFGPQHDAVDYDPSEWDPPEEVLARAAASLQEQEPTGYQAGVDEPDEWEKEQVRLSLGKEVADEHDPFDPEDGPAVRVPPITVPGVEESGDDPHRLARLALQEYGSDGLLTLRYWREEWHQWGGQVYRPVPEKEIRGALSKRIKIDFDEEARQALVKWKGADKEAGKRPPPKPVARKVSGRLVGDVCQALISECLLPASVPSPSWLRGGEGFPAAEVLACKNALIHVPSWAAGRDAQLPLSPLFFSPIGTGYDFSAHAPTPWEWLNFLGRLWPNDPESIEALQEWAGYCLLPDTRLQKILLLIGPKRSGKGTIARVLSALIGTDNVVTPTLSSLGERFGLQPLLGKTLAIITDARLSGRADIASIVERLLSISGEDLQTVDRKNMSPITARLLVRFMILTNEAPEFTDASKALPGRLVVIKQTESWYGREDTHLTDRLLRELPGILLWALEGWKRLQKRGQLKTPASSQDIVSEIEEMASPISAFLDQCCERGAGLMVPKGVLFERWLKWCQQQGIKNPGTNARFGNKLRATVPGLGYGRPGSGDSRAWCYRGIGLRVDLDDCVSRNPFEDA